jgi:thioredoxin-like negative regulator of GroEL
MSRLIPTSQELFALIRSKPRVMILFYAAWCPFSRAFLPCFEESASDRDMARVLVDDVKEAADAFRVEVYPTILYFENGSLAKRLDGRAGVGLSESQLQDFISVCRI